MKSKMRWFTKDRKKLYIATDQESDIHYVPNINWLDYLDHRKVVPVLCVLLQTQEETEQVATFEERNGFSHPGPRKEIFYDTHTITDSLEYAELLGRRRVECPTQG